MGGVEVTITMKYLSTILILIAVVFEVGADILFKEWSLQHKQLLFYSGLGVYFVGTVFWAYSLKFDYLSKAITVFTVLNLIAVILVGVFFFHESLSNLNKLGIVLGIISVLLLQI